MTKTDGKYRVKVFIKDTYDGPRTKYVIQIHRFLLGWIDDCKETNDKEWAYKTCEELNMSYEEAAKKVKK